HAPVVQGPGLVLENVSKLLDLGDDTTLVAAELLVILVLGDRDVDVMPGGAALDFALVFIRIGGSIGHVFVALQKGVDRLLGFVAQVAVGDSAYQAVSFAAPAPGRCGS